MKGLLFPALAATALLGCGDLGLAPGEFGGRYDLRAVNGQGLPFVLEQIPGVKRIEVTAGRVDADPKGTYLYSLTVREVRTTGESASLPLTVRGHWAQDGSTITLVSEEGDTVAATANDDRLTITASSHLYEYQR
jgi:hypothetical protein